MRSMVSGWSESSITRLLGVALAAGLAFVPVGCGPAADGDPTDVGDEKKDDEKKDDEKDDEKEDMKPQEFSTEPLVFVAEVGTTSGVCFDFDTAEAVDCDSSASRWDLFFNVNGMSYNIWTNGGIHGKGDGGAFGPATKDDVDAMKSSKDVPGIFRDYLGGVFADAPWQTYDVYGTHDITANHRVYVVKTSKGAKYRVQILSYYGAAGSGVLSVRYGVLGDDGDVREIEVDARAGGFGAPASDPANKFTYLDLDEGKILELSDEEARQTNTNWELGFKRYDVIVNSGASGKGSVEAAVADKREALYDPESGAPIKSKFEDAAAEGPLNAFKAVDSDVGLTFVQDKANTYIINDGGEKSWFQVEAPPPKFTANPDVWWVVRSAEGDSFAKMHVTKVEYPARHFTVELFVQPRAGD